MNIFCFIFVVFAFCQIVYSQELDHKDCKCRLPISKLIVGGKESTSVPWVVSLSLSRKPFCGAILLNHQWIITASHCVDDLKNPKFMSLLKAHIGLHYLNDSNIEEKTFSVRRIVTYEDFSGTNGDFAMIQVDGQIQFSSEVHPACLSEEFRHYDGELYAIGFGSIKPLIVYPDGSESKTELSNHLKSAKLIYQKCESHLICTKLVKGRRDSICLGDSGNGLYYDQSGHVSVIGVASSVYGHKRSDRSIKFCDGSSEFSRISAYLPMIQSLVGTDYCKL